MIVIYESMAESRFMQLTQLQQNSAILIAAKEGSSYRMLKNRANLKTSMTEDELVETIRPYL